MKKVNILLAFILTFVVIFATGCGSSNNVITISEVAHSLFYAPMYIADSMGYFEEEGLNIEIELANGSDVVMASLISGSADIGLLGPETVVYMHSNSDTILPTIFGQLTACDGSFLVARTDTEDFDWSDLIDSHVIAGRKAGLPAMSLEYVLKQNGLIPGDEIGVDDCNVFFDTSIEYSLTVPTFTGGTGDYVTVFEPSASSIELEEQGYIVASVGEYGGNLPFTAFASMTEYMDDNPETIESFLNAVAKGYEFLMNASDQEIADALKSHFSTTSDELIISSVNNYMSINAYASDFVFTEESWTLLQDVMESAGELTERIEYSDAIDNTYAYNLLND